MSNKLKLKGAKPLLTLSANNEFAKLEIADPHKAFELLYSSISTQMIQASMVIMLAVERMRQCNPEMYAKYMERINRALMRGSADNNCN